MENFRLLRPDDIECKVKQITDYGAVLLLYKTARTDMDCLDEAVGPLNWQSDYKEIKGNLYCGIGIRENDGSDRFVWKWDCGIESREDNEGNQKKGEASDAFKRAGFKCGIGRELYTGPKIKVPLSFIKLDSSGKRTWDTFSVSKIEYDDKRNISALEIVNDRSKEVCFSWSAVKGNAAKPPKKKGLFCAECEKEITEVTGSTGTKSPEEFAELGRKDFGKQLCMHCYMKHKVEAAK